MSKVLYPLVLSLWLGIFFGASAQADSGQLSAQHLRDVELRFALFSWDWIDKIDRSFASRLENKELLTRENQFIGRYMQIDRTSVSWSVKQVSTSPPAYIGLLKYLEWTYESAAHTREAALLGPFVPVSGRSVTEIFQYTQNRWRD
jgi:hypothetical protein